jgi:arabinogalactan oligomer/maltooligosaccharide transport system substrate-binding protein
LSDRFEIEAVAGGGPDAFIASGDGLVRQAQAGLVRNLDNDLAAQRAAYAPNAVEALTLDGKLYGVPLSRSTIAMYFNRSKVAAPPQSTQQLIDAAKGGARIVLIRSSYHNFGFFGAFGGRLLDESGRCVADAGGVADALRYLRDLKTAGAQFVTDGAEAEARFKTGEADITLNGSWLLTDFRAALGDQLGVAAIPAGPAGPAKPLVGSSGIFVNAAAPQAEKAVALALQLTSPEAQALWADQAGQTPTNPSVAIGNDAVGGVAAAALTGIARSQRPELDAAWPPFDSALADVLENDADPVAAVQAACAATNAANGK